MRWHPEQFDAVCGKPDICKSHRRTWDLVGFLKSDLKLVGPLCDSVEDLRGIRKISAVGSRIQ